MSIIQTSLTFSGSGSAWIAQSGYEHLVENEYLRFTINNPAGSGKALYVYSITLNGEVDSAKVGVYRNPGSVSVHTVAPQNQNIYPTIFTATAQLNYDIDTNDLSGTLERQVPLLPTKEVSYENEMYDLPAGSSLGISVRALIETDVMVTVNWIEQ